MMVVRVSSADAVKVKKSGREEEEEDKEEEEDGDTGMVPNTVG